MATNICITPELYSNPYSIPYHTDSITFLEEIYRVLVDAHRSTVILGMTVKDEYNQCNSRWVPKHSTRTVLHGFCQPIGYYIHALCHCYMAQTTNREILFQNHGLYGYRGSDNALHVWLVLRPHVGVGYPAWHPQLGPKTCSLRISS